ncbi:CGGC domain-containing protein [candidate division KSB1 bacterium]
MDELSRRKFCKNFVAIPLVGSGSVSLIEKYRERKFSKNLPYSEKDETNIESRKKTMKKLGIIICNRYHTCAGGKCFRSMKNREGGFERYKDEEIELVGFTTCDGCPGGNVEASPEEMKNNGAEIIHLATGFIVGYPPCPHLEHFTKLIPEKYGLEVVIGTHPIPEKYYITHSNLKTWEAPEWKDHLKETICHREIRLKYD